MKEDEQPPGTRPTISSRPPGAGPLWVNSYARLPERFFARIRPTPVAAPRLIRVNEDLAVRMRLDPAWLASPDGVALLAGNAVPEAAEPIAMAYAGHQFGGWVPQLGDGRAILLGELLDVHGTPLDVHLKGAGRTPFSRRGDGRAALGPVLREYIVSEAMHALGIPTTRSLAMVTTGERVLRDDVLPGAILTRIARSHVRVGTFEYFAHQGDVEAVRVLADYMITRVYPEASGAEDRYRALLDQVILRTAELVARWQLIGFIHGVMNTDNTSISGETIDYGPCAFMDTYDPATVYSSIDRQGRYAYGNQPPIAHWNLASFAQCLLPLLAENPDAALEVAQASINAFPASFEAAYFGGLGRKLGLTTVQPGDRELCQQLLDLMAANKADYTLTFRRLGEAVDKTPASDAAFRQLFERPQSVDGWMSSWHERLTAEKISAADRRQSMHRVNAAYIPRNHRIAAVIDAAQSQGDFAPLAELLRVLATPFEDQPAFASYSLPPRPEEAVLQTFCGT